MTSGRTTLMAATAAVSFLSSACSTVMSPDDSLNPTLQATPVPPTAGFVYWRLPKTVIEATVTFKYKGCTPNGTQPPLIELDRSVAIITKGVPDDDIFGVGARDPWVRVPVSAMTNFFDDRTLTVKRAANGTVSELGAEAEDQTGAIIGNVLSSAVKIGSIVMGVPAAGAGERPFPVKCSDAPQAIKAKMDAIKAELRNPRTTVAQAAAYERQLADQQKLLDKLTVTVPRIIDPGATSLEPPICEEGKACEEERLSSVQADGLIARIFPTADQVLEAGWVTLVDPKGPKNDVTDTIRPVAISLILDFPNATPSIVGKCNGNARQCAHRRTVIDRDTHFRDVAYIPLIVRGTNGNAAQDFELTVNGARAANALPFAQFGIPRRLPIKAGWFEKIGWSFSFNEFGEPTSAKFGSSARGTKASGVLAGAAGAASSLAAQNKAATAADSETARLQAEAAKLKAQIDVATYRAQVEELRSKGQLPE